MKRCRFVFALFLGSAALVCSALATDILTNRGNDARTGLNAHETILTKSLVSSSSFGLVYNKSVDGKVYAQPLYVSNQLIIVNGQSRGEHNVCFTSQPSTIASTLSMLIAGYNIGGLHCFYPGNLRFHRVT